MIKIAEPNVNDQDIESVIKALQETQLSGRSPICKQFEDEYAKKFNVKHAIAVNSGTSALFLSMKAMGIGEGDEVIVPSYAFMAVPNAVVHTGAKPIFVDSDIASYNIDPFKVKNAITSKTKAIIAVHTYGYPCNMDTLLSYGIPVIEDAAEAHGALYKGKIVGSIGKVGCFSFFANKTITTGEGGMVTTNDDILAEEIRKLKDQYNGPVRYKHDKIGYGMSLGALQCALGLSQLKRLDELVQTKIEIANRYNAALKDLVLTPYPVGDIKHSYWMYNIKAPIELYNYLARFIEVRPSFYPLHWQEPYKQDGFPMTEWLYKVSFCLPMSTTMTLDEQNYVIKKIFDFYNERGTISLVNKGEKPMTE